MSKVKACYSCAQDGVWGPYHALILGPETGTDRFGPTRDRTQDKTLCGISLTDMWERDVVGINPARIECKRCRAILKKQGKLDPLSRILPQEVRQNLPPLYSQEVAEDPIVHIKWFSPVNYWQWFATEGEEQNDDWMFFGLVKGFENELGYFTLSQLKGFGAEVATHFTPKPLSEVWDKWPFD